MSRSVSCRNISSRFVILLFAETDTLAITIHLTVS